MARTKKVQPVEQAQVIETIFAASADTDDLEDMIKMATKGTLLDSEINTKRKWISFLSSLVTSFGVSYFGCSASAYVAVFVLTLSGSMLMSFIAWILGVVLSVYAGLKLGSYIGKTILLGDIDRAAIHVGSKIKNIFTFRKTATT